jgi:hypothetical protein
MQQVMRPFHDFETNGLTLHTDTRFRVLVLGKVSAKASGKLLNEIFRRKELGNHLLSMPSSK